MEFIFKKVESTIRPKALERNASSVYIRKNITSEKRIDSLGNAIIFWVYEEAKVSEDEFELYSVMNDNISDNQLIIMEAIADLYDIIASMQ